MNNLKELTHVLNAEIRRNFESGNYEISRQNHHFYMIKMDGIEAEMYTFYSTSSVELILALGGKIEFTMAAFDLYLEKVEAYKTKSKLQRIAELEKELKEVKNG